MVAINKNEPINLDNIPPADWEPFADEDELADDGTKTPVTQTPAPQPAKTEAQTPAPEENQSAAVTVEALSDVENTAVAESDNLPAATADTTKPKETGKAKPSFNEKLPVFDYSGALEDIEDGSQTFDELRMAKAADFPELEDGKRVSWTIEYGKITKKINDEKEAKGMTIGKMKSDIETSTEFLDALKKSRDKNPVCKVKPRATAQPKGASSASSSYKGVYTNKAEADASGKFISILPASDGNVYEMRNTPIGKFITPVVGCELLSDVQAGFIPALDIPLIPMDLIMRIIDFFRYFTIHGGDNEVLVNIYWDKVDKAFVVDAPEQTVSKVSVHSNENPDYLNERYIHFMDIHSHNSMRAFFSPIDDEGEKATRLYTVIGRLDKYFPEIKTRISNGGKFHEIDSAEVFEYIARPFPPEWKENVITRAAHNYIDILDVTCDCATNQNPDCKGNDEDCPWNLNRSRDARSS